MFHRDWAQSRYLYPQYRLSTRGEYTKVGCTWDAVAIVASLFMSRGSASLNTGNPQVVACFNLANTEIGDPCCCVFEEATFDVSGVNQSSHLTMTPVVATAMIGWIQCRRSTDKQTDAQ